MILVDDSVFSEREKLLVQTTIQYASGKVPFAYVAHVIQWGTLPPKARINTANG